MEEFLQQVPFVVFSVLQIAVYFAAILAIVFCCVWPLRVWWRWRKDKTRRV